MGDVLKQIFNGCQLVVALKGINVVRYRYQPYVVFREEFLCKPADLDIVAAQARKVFYEYSGSFAILELLQHITKGRPIHGHAGNTVVAEMHQVCISHFLCHFNQQLFLICYAVTLTLQIIITR